MKNNFIVFSVCSILLASNTSVNALSIDYALEGGAATSDNINRSATAPVKDDVLLLLGELNIEDNSSTNDLLLGMEIRHLQYKDNTFDDDTRANMDLESRWSIVNDSLSWVVNGYYGQQAIDIFSVTTQDNLQNIGVLSTGPDYIMRFTSIDSLTIGYRYLDYYAEITDADYSSNLYSLSFARRLSPLATISLNTTYDEIDYENNDTVQDFDETRYFIAVSGSSVATQYTLVLGQIDLKFDDNAEFDNALKQFSFVRQINSNNMVNFELLETVDTGARSINRTVTNAIISNDVFVNKRANIGYSYNRGDFMVRLNHRYSAEDYRTDNDQDRNVRSSRLSIGYGSPISLRIGLDYLYTSTDFYVRNQMDQENTINLRFEKRVTGNLNAVFEIENYNRESETITGTTDIEENTYILTLRYANRI